MKACNPSKIGFRGYTKKENGHWIAVCIDLNIAAQGKNYKEATQNCIEMIEQYINFVRSTYPQKADKYIPRFAPKEFIDEYNELLQKSLMASPTSKSSSVAARSKSIQFFPAKSCDPKECFA